MASMPKVGSSSDSLQVGLEVGGKQRQMVAGQQLPFALNDAAHFDGVVVGIQLYIIADAYGRDDNPQLGGQLFSE